MVATSNVCMKSIIKATPAKIGHLIVVTLPFATDFLGECLHEQALEDNFYAALRQ